MKKHRKSRRSLDYTFFLYESLFDPVLKLSYVVYISCVNREEKIDTGNIYDFNQRDD